MLAGQMMDFPLTLTHFLDRAACFFPNTEIVSQRPDKTVRRTTYDSVVKRSAKLAHALRRLGIGAGDRVATLMWNSDAHLETYLAAPCMGAVVHTLNLRLHPREIAYIASHAEDRVVIVDRSLLPLFEKFRGDVKSIRHVIVHDDGGDAETKDAVAYEALLAPESDTYDWPSLDEKSAAMICYTSGTTGNPKGVVYSHRSTVLHAIVAAMTDAIGVSESDSVMPVVPMFHAAAWGLPYVATLVGAKQVFPGPHLDARSLLDLMAAERVSVAGGVPTIWLPILALLDREPKSWDLSAMRSMVIGGSAAPKALIEGFQKRHGITVTHAWGMTETNPLGSMARVKRNVRAQGDEAALTARATQGYAVPFVEQRHRGDDGKILPWDGTTMGELEVRGPWVASSYFGGEGTDRFTSDGWFKTGDVVTIDPEGYIRITDRLKDVIKSGGEWISSVELENALMSHPAVLEAAVFAAKHEKWSERPVAAVVLKKDATATKDELFAHLEGKFAKFWMPDEILFVSEIPRTSTGKFWKTKLREIYGDVLAK